MLKWKYFEYRSHCQIHNGRITIGKKYSSYWLLANRNSDLTCVSVRVCVCTEIHMYEYWICTYRNTHEWVLKSDTFFFENQPYQEKTPPNICPWVCDQQQFRGHRWQVNPKGAEEMREMSRYCCHGFVVIPLQGSSHQFSFQISLQTKPGSEHTGVSPMDKNRCSCLKFIKKSAFVTYSRVKYCSLIGSVVQSWGLVFS